MSEPLIDPERVMDIMADSLYTSDEIAGLPKGEIPEGAVVAQGIMTTVGFHPERLESHRDEVETMLKNLPVQFRLPDAGGGGGWSFLNACQDANDEQWTGLHQVMDALFTLGFGLGAATFLMPRDMWAMFPGGMPYIAVLV